MKYITVKLTEEQAWVVWRGVGHSMEDYTDDYTDDPNSLTAKENKRVARENAYLQRLQDKIAKQIYSQSREA